MPLILRSNHIFKGGTKAISSSKPGADVAAASSPREGEHLGPSCRATPFDQGGGGRGTGAGTGGAPQPDCLLSVLSRLSPWKGWEATGRGKQAPPSCPCAPSGVPRGTQGEASGQELSNLESGGRSWSPRSPGAEPRRGHWQPDRRPSCRVLSEGSTAGPSLGNEHCR